MKILKLIIVNYQQFKHLELDFTHPETGEPLDKICFIGRNATGKSTILNIINDYLTNTFNLSTAGFIAFKILNQNETFYLIYFTNNFILFNIDIEKIPNWTDEFMNSEIVASISEVNDYQNGNTPDYLTDRLLGFGKEHQKSAIHYFDFLISKNKKNYDRILKEIVLQNALKDLIVFCPSESTEILDFTNLPPTNLSVALKNINYIPIKQIVSESNITDFWNLLIYKSYLRKKNFEEFALTNKSKVYEQIIDDFNSKNPELLKELSKIWNTILGYANLYFDYENAKVPILPDENLEAYIKLKSTNETIPYNKLGTGIRNFIFKIGHIYSLFFNRKIERGFLLVDEPENSLFPDFLYDLMDDVYCKIIENQNTQFFVATHNPIIAAQFEPYERIILDFDDDGYVYAKKGVVPVGDDPNDILYKDFGMRALMTTKGMEKYKEYQKLRKELRNTTDSDLKKQLLEQISKIGTAYNLPE